MKKNRVLIIVPAYNEEANILNVYRSMEQYSKKSKINYDVIVINDGSTDHTEEVLKENQIPYITLVHNLGIGGAVQTGYKYAYDNNYDVAVQFDGDGQHKAEYIEKIVKPIIDKKANFVIGSRFVEKSKSKFKSTKIRRLGIKMISSVMKILTGNKIYDTTSGFRAADKLVISEFAHNYPLEYPEPITTTELIKKGYKVVEKAVDMNERMGGKSSIHSWKNAYYMVNVLLSIVFVGMRRYKK